MLFSDRSNLEDPSWRCESDDGVWLPTSPVLDDARALVNSDSTGACTTGLTWDSLVGRSIAMDPGCCHSVVGREAYWLWRHAICNLHWTAPS